MITIPESADFTNGKYLMFYVTHGKTATICFDNIKVTALASVDLPESDYDKDTVLAYNDYSDALTQLDGTDVWPGLFVGSSGDAIPVNDPIDSSNQAMMYSQYWYGKGALFLGSDYMTYRSEIIKNEGIEVEPGITYEIKYDFYASGEVTHSMGLNVYLAVGNNAGDDSSEAYTITTSYQETIAQYTLGHSFEMSDWERDNKVWITIPEDVDLSNGSYLMIVAEHGAKDADIYFDNEAVRHYGVMPHEVTDIIITHADHDHIDGVHHFENAIIHIQEDEYARGKHYIPDTFKVELFKEDKIVAEEIKVVKIGGHQIGSCVVEFEFNDLKCVVVGDECYSDYNIKNKVPTASTCNIENSTAFIEKYVGSEYKLLLMHG